VAKKPRYTQEDVDRWREDHEQWLPVLLDRLRNDPDHRAIRRGGGYAALGYKAWGRSLYCIAEGSFAKALGWLWVCADVRARLYEAFSAGSHVSPEYLGAGNWQALLHAHASTDGALTARFCRLYDLELAARPEARSTRDSMYHGRLLKALTEGRVDDARGVLGERRPKVEAMFRGYVECMEAVAADDDHAFREAISAASTAWEKYASRFWRGLPDAVCFLNGVGLIRLAEHVWGRGIIIEDPSIPGELQGDVQMERIDLGL